MSGQLHLLTETLLTPIGTLVMMSDEDGQLRAVDWVDFEDRMRKLLARHYGPQGVRLTPAVNATCHAAALSAYFEGDLHAIDALVTATAGTPFQKRVWKALREIPAGETISYGDLAKRIGQPMAVRAVGLANGANPVSLVVPCHRVIGVDGSLTGYGGGLDRKRWLLSHEKQATAHAARSAASSHTTAMAGCASVHH
ncbi:MAG: methylated-DNA--[protein]-cysteine S-methyltransferase [Nitrospira sp.]|nr:methylated-DNA--[protein]-cysteine S-methyltransferase [Nitrospira sp.]